MVVAKGKGVEVKRSQLDDAMVSIKSAFSARGQDLPPDEMHRLEQQVLDRLIQIQILLGKATDSDKAAGKEPAPSASRPSGRAPAARKLSIAN